MRENPGIAAAVRECHAFPFMIAASLTELLSMSMEWIKGSGWVGMVVFILLYTLVFVFLLPGSPFVIGVAAVYGFWLSVPLVALSSTCGGAVSFLISRYLARDWIERKLGHDRRFHVLERAVGSAGWKVILLSRISPIMPHTLVSYAAGLTRISFWRFTMATFLGFLPMSIAYSYTGAFLGKAVRASSGSTPTDPVTWAFYILGFIATIVATVLATRATSRAWEETVGQTEKAQPEPAMAAEHDRVNPPTA